MIIGKKFHDSAIYINLLQLIYFLLNRQNKIFQKHKNKATNLSSQIKKSVTILTFTIFSPVKWPKEKNKDNVQEISSKNS